jgi:uncharacterized protein (DUF2147 family)
MIACMVFLFGMLFSGIVPLGQDVRTESDRIIGEWTTAEGKARVLITRCDSLYCGKIVWLKDPLENGSPVVDSKNADLKLRNTPILGMTLLRGYVLIPLFGRTETWTR